MRKEPFNLSTSDIDRVVDDEVRVYNRALSQSEITDLYNTGAKRVKIKQ